MPPSQPETRLSSQCLYDGRVVRLELDAVRLASGLETQREVIRHPGAVVIVPLTDDGRVVLIRQYRYAAGRTLLELPAGTLDHPGEEPQAAAERELLEETGHRAREWRRIAGFFSAPGFCDELLHCYLALGAQPAGEAAPDPDETVETVLLPLSAAQTMARRGELADAKTICGLLLVHAEERPPGPA